MPSLILTRLRQGKRTLPFPETDPVLPERFRGLPDRPIKMSVGLHELRRCLPDRRNHQRRRFPARSRSLSILPGMFHTHVPKGRSGSLGNIDLQPAIGRFGLEPKGITCDSPDVLVDRSIASSGALSNSDRSARADATDARRTSMF